MLGSRDDVGSIDTERTMWGTVLSGGMAAPARQPVLQLPRPYLSQPMLLRKSFSNTMVLLPSWRDWNKKTG